MNSHAESTKIFTYIREAFVLIAKASKKREPETHRQSGVSRI